MSRFSTGVPQAFDSVYVDPLGRDVVRTAVQQRSMRRDETNRVRRFSGFYEATRTNGTWMLGPQLPLDSLNYIRAQAIRATITPGKGLRDARHAHRRQSEAPSDSRRASTMRRGSSPSRSTANP
jgi:hypothetical protein